jgi:hypothetical protein
MMECLFQRATKASNNLFVTMAFGHVNGVSPQGLSQPADWDLGAVALSPLPTAQIPYFLASVCTSDGADGVFRDGASSTGLV